MVAQVFFDALDRPLLDAHEDSRRHLARCVYLRCTRTRLGSDQVIGAMNLFCIEQKDLSDDDLALGQALADVATIGLLHERAVQQLEVLAEQLQTALNSRVLIEQAKGALAERANVEVDEAFVMMRSHSRAARRRLSDVAAEVLDGR